MKGCWIDLIASVFTPWIMIKKFRLGLSSFIEAWHLTVSQCPPNEQHSYRNMHLQHLYMCHHFDKDWSHKDFCLKTIKLWLIRISFVKSSTGRVCLSYAKCVVKPDFDQIKCNFTYGLLFLFWTKLIVYCVNISNDTLKSLSDAKSIKIYIVQETIVGACLKRHANCIGGNTSY